ncbi:MAG: bifunctional metallophosphatase/5'-nucleotidase [Methanospirillum sp.]
MADGALALLQLNDTHAYLEPHPEVFWEAAGPTIRTAGGYARIAALVSRVREETGGKALLLDCGDTLHGTAPAVKTRGAAMVPVLNALGIAAMTGHWDFAYGPTRLHELAARLDYPFLALNCYDRTTGSRPFPPSALVETPALTVGVAGIAATILDKVMPPSFAAGLRFTDGIAELPEVIADLRDAGAGLVVVLSHLGLPQDVRLAKEVNGIDVLLSGHTHNRLDAPIEVNGALLIQSGVHGSFVGRLDLEVRDGRIARHAHRLIEVGETCPTDPAVDALVEQAVGPFREELGHVAGETAVPLYRGEMVGSSMDDLLLDALRRQTGAALAFSNGWRYGAPVRPGPVTKNDLYDIVPMDPEVTTVTLAGAEVLGMLEQNLERTFACDPFGQMGGYVKRCQGLVCYVKLENPPGHRIQACWAGGRRLDPGRRYAAAFVTVQGVPAGLGEDRAGTGIGAVAAMEELLAAERPYRGERPPAFRVI